MNGDAAGRRVAFVVPGGLGRVTGGNVYDLAVIDELRARGWAVDVVEPEASLEGADVVVVDSLSLPYGPPATDAPLVALLHQVPSEAEGHSEWRTGEAGVLGRSDLVVAVGGAV